MFNTSLSYFILVNVLKGMKALFVAYAVMNMGKLIKMLVQNVQVLNNIGTQ